MLEDSEPPEQPAEATSCRAVGRTVFGFLGEGVRADLRLREQSPGCGRDLELGPRTQESEFGPIEAVVPTEVGEASLACIDDVVAKVGQAGRCGEVDRQEYRLILGPRADPIYSLAVG